MVKTVIGVFDSYDQAEKAVAKLRQSGYDTNEISMLQRANRVEMAMMTKAVLL